MAIHPTQIFLHNPKALRVEYRLDDQQLILWWSPKAGESFDCRDRNFSNRDNHLSVFESIHLPGCDLPSFERCDYDPYLCVLHFKHQTLRLAVSTDKPVLLLCCDQPQRVMFKTHRYDRILEQSQTTFAVSHDEADYRFEFAAACNAAGRFRHCYFRGPNYSVYSEATIDSQSSLAIAVGLAGEEALRTSQRLAEAGLSALTQSTDSVLEMSEAFGRVHMPGHPGLESLRKKAIRGLHSMIDDSGAMRASLKAIYYLIWVRDGGFCFPYHAASGWMHRFAEFCRLLLENPTTASGDGIPPGRMFAQLINKDYGKYEEDGIFYVLFCVFTYWTQTDDNTFVTGENLALLEEAMAWVERYIFDAERGLFGQYFADETPAVGSRDDGWDYAIGQPIVSERPTFEGTPITRFYDTYINVLMHSAYTMLAAITSGTASEAYTAKAAKLWDNVSVFFHQRVNGLPQYGELQLADGRRVMCPPWKLEVTTVYTWALALPSFVPVDDWDLIRQKLLEHIVAHPTLFWINSLCAAIAGVDPYVYDERRLLDALETIRKETETPGPFLPMGGAMPEKLGAPQGNLYHDIRPQGFAMGSFLGALSSLGLRRLPYGLAVRATAAISKIENYPWRGKMLNFAFEGSQEKPALKVNGHNVPGTLQIPESSLSRDTNDIIVAEGKPGILLLRSTIRLETVDESDGTLTYAGYAFGLSEMSFNIPLPSLRLESDSGQQIPYTVTGHRLHHLRFTHKGFFSLNLVAS